MRFIPRTFHGVLDYTVGLFLVFSPGLLGFSHSETGSNVAFVFGGGAVLYSVFTAYELGVFKIIPFGVHLALDTLSGVLLLVSPWLFGFADEVTAPHVAIGAFELLVVACTRRGVIARPIVTSR